MTTTTPMPVLGWNAIVHDLRQLHRGVNADAFPSLALHLAAALRIAERTRVACTPDHAIIDVPDDVEDLARARFGLSVFDLNREQLDALESEHAEGEQHVREQHAAVTVELRRRGANVVEFPGGAQ